MSDPPEFRELVGDDLSAEEQARLERVHELLVEAGPPPELPPTLLEAPDRAEQPPTWLPRRRVGAVYSLAAAIAVAAFLGGYVTGFKHNSFNAKREVSMQGTAAAPHAGALIKLGAADEGGNWPMVVTVHGLPQLPGRGYYELFLTRNGKPVFPCGGFDVKPGTTTVKFSVPYSIKPSDDWVVTRQNPAERDHGLGPVLLKT